MRGLLVVLGVLVAELFAPPPVRADERWVSLAKQGRPLVGEYVTVWTGRSLAILGNLRGGGRDGALYDPNADRWSSMLLRGGPGWIRSAGWTGNRIVVVGTANAMYEPEQRVWEPMRMYDGPSAEAILYWADSGLVGVEPHSSAFDARIFNAEANRWTIVPPTAEVHPRAGVAWSGSDLLAWGGESEGTVFRQGAIYDVADGVWRSMTEQGAPSGRVPRTTIWTGARLLVWGARQEGDPGQCTCEDGHRLPPRNHTCEGAVPCNDGAMYDAARDTWTVIPPSPSTAPYAYESTFWTGEHLVIFRSPVGLDQSLPVPVGPDEGMVWSSRTGQWRLLPPTPVGTSTSGLIAGQPERCAVVRGQLWCGWPSQVLALDAENGRWRVFRFGPRWEASYLNGLLTRWAGDRLFLLSSPGDDRRTLRATRWSPPAR